jgi:hypothetical protein
MADFYRDVIRLLREAGYEFKRQGRAITKFGGIREPEPALRRSEAEI